MFNWFKLLLQKITLFNASTKNKEPKFIWCLVGNIDKENNSNQLKYFASNTKVYCFPPLWGDGYEKINVIGFHKKRKQYFTIIISSKHIKNWRLQKVYKPYILSKMNLNKGWTCSDIDKNRITELRDNLLKQK